MNNIKKRVKEISFAVIIWFLFFALLNFVSGLVIKNRYVAVEPVDDETAATSWGYFKPNQEKILLFPGYKEYKVTINSMGLRSTGWDKEYTLDEIKDRDKILTIGDSMTFSSFVDDEDSYPYQLQQMLKQDGKNAVVLNAGVGWSTITDFLYYMKKKGLSLNPNLVILSFCENDLSGLDDKPVYERLKNSSVLSFFDKIKLTKFMRFFRKVELYVRYARSTRKIKDARVKDILFRQSKDLDDVLYVAKYESGMEAMDPYNKELVLPWKKYFETLDEMVGMLRERHIDLLYVIYPNILTVFDLAKDNYQDILIAHLNKLGVRYVDLRPIFQKRRKQYLDLYHNLPRDFHLSGMGNKIVAYSIYDKIKKQVR